MEEPPFVEFEEPTRYWVVGAMLFFGLVGLGFLAGISLGPACDPVRKDSSG